MMYSLLGRAVCAAGALLASCGTGSAHAYSTRSVVSDGCHESTTFSAIRAVRNELATAGPIPAHNDDERALLDDLPFSLPKDMADLAAVSAVLGNRNVDLKSYAPDDLDYLAQVHGNPKNQDDHCLRAPANDDPGGDQAALDACYATIRGRVQAALAGLDAEGTPDPALRTKADVYLELRGAVEASLPLYWWEIGRALHTMQDGFSHTFRHQEDQHDVIAVLNYVEAVEGELDESVDGPPHSSSLDKCNDLDGFREVRLQLAGEASVELLRATLDPALNAAGKAAAVDDVLVRYLSYREGCNAENSWCDAPELSYEEERGCVCSMPGGPPGGSGAAWAAVVVLGALAGLSRRRARDARRASRRSVRGVTLAAGISSLLVPALAFAQEAGPPEGGRPVVVEEVDSDADATIADGTIIRTRREDKFPLGVHGTVAASVIKSAAAASLGLRWRLSSHWLVGADGEYNPFYAGTSKELRSGVTNIYATGILRFPMSFEVVNMRSTLNLGISRMNMDLYGVPKGSIGPFIGFNILGVDIELSEQLYLVINPAYVAIPIPQTTGVPYVYPQYRISIGVQIGA